MTPAEAAAAFAAEVRTLPIRTTAGIRKIRQRHSRGWRTRSAEFVLTAAAELARTRALRWAAWEFVRFHPTGFAAIDDARLAGFAAGLDGWDSVDAFARILSGPAWAAGRASDALIDGWSRSPDRWLRRSALVSTVALNRPAEGGRAEGDATRTLAICAQLAADRDDMVVKALSWALRELAQRDPETVRSFVSAREPELAARVKREVGNKLLTGLKNRPRR